MPAFSTLTGLFGVLVTHTSTKGFHMLSPVVCVIVLQRKLIHFFLFMVKNVIHAAVNEALL